MNFDDIKDSSCADSQDVQTTDFDATTENSDSQNSEVLRDFASQDCETSEKHPELKELFKGELDQKFHKEILEKLDILKKEQTQDIQEKLVKENSGNSQLNTKIENQIKTGLTQDIDKIQKLVKAGLINSNQGQNLKNEVLKKAFDKLVQTEKIKRTLLSSAQNGRQIQSEKSVSNVNEVFEEFSQKNPDFFTHDGRKEVLNYLKTGGAQIGRDELGKISDIIRTVEKAAIDRYLQKVSHEKTLISSNEAAKKRLTANAQKTAFSDKNLLRSFTREQIGKMSGAEFAKYEPFIMEQLKKGLIK